MRLAAVLLVVVAASAGFAGEPLERGTESGLPLDPEMQACWLREPARGIPGEGVCYRQSGRYVRITGAGAEQGVWVTLRRGSLRWLRRCHRAGGGPVSPEDCGYFGRYLLSGDEMLEEEACPGAWQGALSGDPRFEALSGACGAVATRLAEDMSDEELVEAYQAMMAEAPTFPAAAAAQPAAGSGGGSMQGTWIGTVGSGPGKVTLTFHAREGGDFEYVLEAAGQRDSAGGRWKQDNGLLVLEHADGEVEKIPFRIEGSKLYWTDEDLGELELVRGET